MNSTINWADFNGDKFQSFCNDLLSFEIGKNFIPFSAPGADQGIDGLYEGEYNDKKGKWRFQAKFHHPDTGRMAAINQLKDQVKKDLTNNVKNESYVIFITNIEINPKQRKELIKLAYDTIHQIKKQVDFDIWDGAKITTLLAYHPILKLWYVNESKHLIQEYNEFFQSELNPDTDAAYQLANKFYHREQKLDELKVFINDDTKIAAVISGEAGIGKTRLCVEFFKNYIDKNDKWIALVLIIHSLDYEVIKKALTGKNNYIVLVDDADRFEERDIADLITVIKGIKENKVKLLLTVRSYSLKKIFSKTPINQKHQLVKPIELSKLTPEETAKFLENELKRFKIKMYLSSLVEMTHGVPIMIVTLLKIIKSGTPLRNINKDAFLQEYIQQHFNNLSKVLSQENEIQRKDVTKLINLLALIEPVQIDNRPLIELIAKTEKITTEDVNVILQALKNENIISGRYQFAIKPDMYSDFMLEKALQQKNWLKDKLFDYGVYINNIIKNIGYLPEMNENNSVLDVLLSEYIKQIDTCSNYSELSKIIDTIHFLTYSKPSLATEAVEKVVSIYSNEKHPLHQEFQQSLQHKIYYFDTVINGLKSILRNLFEFEDYSSFAYSYTGQLYEILKDESLISNISKFGKSDLFDGFHCEKQNRVLSLSKDELEKKDTGMKLFALNMLKALLRLEFHDAESYLYKKDSIEVYTIYVPENEHVKKLRKDVIELLINVFNQESNLSIKEEILKIIIDIPRGIFAVTSKQYKGKGEIKMILKFLQAISSLNILELKQKQLIKERLYWFKRWGIEEFYNQVIDEIADNLSVNDLSEILLELLNPKYEGKIQEEKEKYRTEAQRIVDSNSAIELGEALVKVVEQSEYVPHNFYPFLGTISTDSKKTKEFINHLWNTNREFVINYCSGLFRTQRFDNESEDFYWEYVKKLLSEESYESRNCILHIYHSFSVADFYNSSNNKAFLKQQDVDLIIKVFKSSTSDNYFQLASALPTLFLVDKKVAIKEIKSFLKVCNERHLDSLFFAFDPFEDKYYQEIKELLFDSTVHLNIPYSVERTLNRIIKQDGFSEVLAYIEKRFLYKRKIVIETKNLLEYEFIPAHTGNTITEDIPEEEKTKIFTDVLNWFVNYDFESFEGLYAKDIIREFSPHKYITPSVKDLYIQLIKKYHSDYQRLLNIIHSLSEFEEKNKDFIDLIIQILDTSINEIKDSEQVKEITSQCYISLTSLGVKTGTPGQPFSVDLQLKDLLEETLNSSKSKNIKIKGFLETVLKSVYANINQAKDEEGAW